VIYIAPGEQLQVIIGLQSGSVLVWESLGNFVLKAHEGPVSHCVSFDKDEDRFLVTLSTKALDLAVWDLNPSRTVSRTGKERMLCRVKLSKTPLKMHWNATHEHLVFVMADCVQVWDLYTPGALRKSSTGKLVFPLYEISRAERKVSASHVDDARSLISVGYDDSAIWIYFLPTGQLLAKLAPTKSNQYFSVFAISSDETTFVAADDFCLHWRPIAKRIIDKESIAGLKDNSDAPSIKKAPEIHPMYLHYPGDLQKNAGDAGQGL
jgi:WD40 repeat protein